MADDQWPNPLQLDEHSHAGMAAAFCAGAARLPFGVLRGYAGTDLPAHNPNIRHVACPFTGELLAAVPAINPDVTILHAQKADAQGTVRIEGLTFADVEQAKAAGVRYKPADRQRKDQCDRQQSAGHPPARRIVGEQLHRTLLRS